MVSFIDFSSKLSNDPAWNSKKNIISEILNDFNISIKSHIHKIRLNLGDLKENFKEIIDWSMGNEGLKLVKDLIHPSEKDLPVWWEFLNEIDSLFDEILFLGLISR